MTPTPTTTLQSETGESVDQRPTPAGEGDLWADLLVVSRGLINRWHNTPELPDGMELALGQFETVLRETEALLATSPPQAETGGLDREAVARIIESHPLFDVSAGTLVEGARSIADAILASTAVSQPPTSRKTIDIDALRGVADDYMTSEKHHPGYVLIPTEKFDQLRSASEALANSPTSRHHAGEVEALRARIEKSINEALVGVSFPGGKWSVGYGCGLAVDAVMSVLSSQISDSNEQKELADWRLAAAKIIEAVAAEWPSDGQSYAKTLSAIFQSDAVFSAQPGPAPVDE